MKHEMAVLDQTGDTKLIWDESNQAEVDAAEAMFNTLHKKGYFAYSVKKDGSAGELVKKFDPSAEKLIMQPKMAGG